MIPLDFKPTITTQQIVLMVLAGALAGLWFGYILGYLRHKP